MNSSLLTIITLVVNLLLALLPGLGLTALTPAIAKLIDTVLAQLPTLWKAFSSSSTTMEVTAALLAIQAVAAEAKGEPSLDPNAMEWLESLDQAVQRALAADAAAAAKVDPETLTDIPELP